MSDGISDGIFPIVHRTFLLSYFRGCWLLDFFVLKAWCGNIMKRQSIWRRPFFLNDYNIIAMSFVTKLNFWRKKLCKTRLDPFLFLSWFTATINTTVCSSRLFSTNLQRHQYELDPVNALFLNCLCSSIFLENSRVLLSFFINGLLTIE